MNTRYLKVRLWTLMFVQMAAFDAWGESQVKESENGKWNIDPVLIDAKDGTGSVLAVDYRFDGVLLKKSFEAKEEGAVIDTNATIGNFVVEYDAKGTVAVSKVRNPKNLIEFELNAKYERSTSSLGSILGGFVTKYEADQSFENKQFIYGLGFTWGKLGLVGDKNDFATIDLIYGRINPKEDKEREIALGTASLDSYYRWNLEILYKYPIGDSVVRDLELNYRYFKEKSPPSAIQDAKLDQFQFATIRLGLKDDLFVAYSVGKLPFDRKNDQIIQVGISYKLK